MDDGAAAREGLVVAAGLRHVARPQLHLAGLRRAAGVERGHADGVHGEQVLGARRVARVADACADGVAALDLRAAGAGVREGGEGSQTERRRARRKKE